jgi:hypothetical protein
VRPSVDLPPRSGIDVGAPARCEQGRPHSPTVSALPTPNRSSRCAPTENEAKRARAAEESRKRGAAGTPSMRVLVLWEPHAVVTRPASCTSRSHRVEGELNHAPPRSPFIDVVLHRVPEYLQWCHPPISYVMICRSLSDPPSSLFTACVAYHRPVV